MYVCVFTWGKGGWLIQQEPKDNSGHLTGIVCMCVCSLGGKGGWLIQQEPKDNSGHLTGIVCMCVCSLGERVGG